MVSPGKVNPTPFRLDAPPNSNVLDTRKYLALTLPNNLAVILVSDKLSNHAAASMDVGVGSFSDPKEIQGLAHFLEHMLFLGTKKYPDETSFDTFISRHGGTTNAYTTVERTNYHFEIQASELTSNCTKPSNFYEALDRFAQFFIAPSFTESATEREIEAVDSEFQSRLQDFKTCTRFILSSVANPVHPFSSNNFGNRDTLFDNRMKKRFNIRSTLLDFHSKYYSANLMKLVIVAPYSLEILQKWVIELFCPIPNHEEPHPWLAYQDIPVLLPGYVPSLIRIETAANIRILHMVWITPPFWKDYRQKSKILFNLLIGDKGNGSILSLLQLHALGTRVKALSVDHKTFGEQHFDIILTKKGAAHVYDVITLVYDYIRFLRKTGLPEWFFKETANNANNEFRFRCSDRAGPLSISLASELQYVPSCDCIYSKYLFRDYNAETFLELLECLTPENGIVILGGQFLPKEGDNVERWTKLNYRLEPIHSTFLKFWRIGRDCLEYQMPRKNMYIPTNFKILGRRRPHSTSLISQGEEGPLRALKTDHVELYHKLNVQFITPRIVMCLRMINSVTDRTPLCSNLSTIFNNIFKELTADHAWNLSKAGFTYSVQCDSKGLNIYLTGYSHQFTKVLTEVIQKLKNFSVGKKLFDRKRRRCRREYASYKEVQPGDHANYSLGSLLSETSWSIEENLMCFHNGSVTIEALREFSQKLLGKTFMKALIIGNVNRFSAMEMIRSVCNILMFEPLAISQKYASQAVRVPLGGSTFLRQVNSMSPDGSSFIKVYYQAEPVGDIKSGLKLQLILMIMRVAAINELRTVQQLGYDVQMGITNYCGIAGMYISIQSAVASPDELLRRIDSFLVDFRSTILQRITKEEFERSRKALVGHKAEKDMNLDDSAARFWAEIENNSCQFDKRRRESQVLQHMSKRDLIDVFDEYVARDGDRRRRIVIQIYGRLHPYEQRTDLHGDEYEICDVASFRNKNVIAL